MNELQLADAAGVSKDVINKLEQGGQDDTTSAKAVRIARVLQCSIEELHGKSMPATAPVPAERVQAIVAQAAEHILFYIQDQKLSDDPYNLGQQIAAVFAQLEEAERLNRRPITARLGGKLVQLRHVTRRMD